MAPIAVEQHIHHRACIERFANAAGLVGVLKHEEESPSPPAPTSADIFCTKRAFTEDSDLGKLMWQIEESFGAEVEACLERETVTSQRAITEYLSMWEIRARLGEDPSTDASVSGHADTVREHEETLTALASLRWGVVRAGGRSRFLCPDRPHGIAYIPISPDVTLVANVADGAASEITVRLWNRQSRDNCRRLVFGRPDDIEAFASTLALT